MSSNNRAANILIVDDEYENLQLLSQILTEQGFSVKEAKSGLEAIKLILAATPDLILLDIVLPDLSGYDVCAQLKADVGTCDIPILFLGEPNGIKNNNHRVDAVGPDYLRKPFRADEVLTLVEKSLEAGRLRTTLAQQRDALRHSNQLLTLEVSRRERAEEALRNAQKMESFRTLAGGIAHDFNNLLNAVIGQCALALDKLPHQSIAGGNVAKALRAAERAADLTQQLLVYSGRGNPHFDEIDLNSLVKENILLLEVAISKSTELRFEFGSPSPRIQGDIGQIQQLILGLIMNAGEAMGPIPGFITIRTGRIELTEHDSEYSKYSVAPLPQGTYALLQVSDTGHGMSRKEIDRIFDPLFSTEFTGRGLGLAAVLGIIKGHFGGVCITSEEGTGTRFDVVFPLVLTPEGPGREEEERACQDVDGEGKTVLVIDDEPSVLETLTDVLTEARFTVLGALSPKEGIDLYRHHSSTIAMVVLDYSMPGMDGKAAFEELVKINNGVKVLLCSGYMQERVESSFDGPRPAGFIHKPYQPAELLDRMSRVLSH
jgi:two-component system cell cycle sensor histidine kinase/response regulator CckA